MSDKLENRKFLSLLSCLEMKEIKEFKAFLKSASPPVEDQKQGVQLLAATIKEAKKQKDDFGVSYLVFPAGTSEKLASKLYGHTSDQGRNALGQHFSYLRRALQRFVAERSAASEIMDIVPTDFIGELRYLEFLQKRGQSSFFRSHLKNLKERLDNEKRSEHLLRVLSLTEQLEIKQRIKDDTKLKSVSCTQLRDYTEKANLLSSLKLHCTMASLEISRAVNRCSGKETHPQGSISEGPQSKADYWQGQVKLYEQEVLIQLWYGVYMAYADERSLAHYDSLISLVEQHHESIADEELLGITQAVEGLCLERTRNQDDQEWRELLLRIYKQLHKSQLLVPGKSISIRSFVNKINEYAKAKNIEWGHEFIEQYSPKLPGNSRDKIVGVGEAILLFEDGKFEMAIDRLNVPDLLYELDHKLENNRIILLFKSFYEANKLDHLQHQLDRRLASFARTTKLVPGYVKPSKLFLQALRKLTKLRVDLDRNKRDPKAVLASINKQRSLILEAEKIDNQKWLLEKVEIFEARFIEEHSL